MHEIKIYGYISNDADKAAGDISLSDVQAQLALANGESVKVRINSNGGDADEGFAIYNELRRYAKENSATIHTFGESRLGSIATVIFLAGDERELSKDLQPFVHKAYYDTEHEIPEAQEAYLKELNERIAKHYEAHTELSFAEALELMEAETYIDTEIAKAMRFATSIEEVLRPVALKRFKNQKPNDDMTNNTKAASILNRVEKFLQRLAGAVNKIVYTADEKELDFYELGEDDPIEVGAKANFDGAAAEGSFVMQSGETYVFAAGELTEIVAAEEEEDIEALKAERDALAEQLEAVTNKAEELVTANASLTEELGKFKNAKSAPAAPAAAKAKPTTAAPAKVNRAAAALEKIKNRKQENK